MYRFLKDSVMPALVLPFESLANWRGDGISPGFDKSDFERACDASVGAAVAVGDKQAFTICNNVIEPAPYGIVVFNDRYVVVVGCAEHDEDRLLGHINDRGRAKLLGQLDLSASGKLAVIGISVDDEPDGIKDFAKQTGAKFPLAWDEGQALSRQYEPSTMPTR